MDDQINKLVDLNNRKNRLLLYLSSGGLILFLMIAFTFTFSSQLFNKLYPKPLSQAATLPSAFSLNLYTSNRLALNTAFTVQLKVRNDAEAATLFTAKIIFPANLVQVINIDTTGSFVTNWADSTFNNTTGTISIIGSTAQSGFKTSGTQALMATIYFKSLANTSGSANIAFDTSSGQSSISRNSDKTNILASTSPLIVKFGD